MSKELDEYLDNMPIFVFKLVDGGTIIGEIMDNDGKEILLSNPQEIALINSEDGSMNNIYMNEWIYGSDSSEVLINCDKVIAKSEASIKLKNFYSKVNLQNKVKTLAKEMGMNGDTVFDSLSFVKSLFNGLDNKDYSDGNDDDFHSRRFNF